MTDSYIILSFLPLPILGIEPRTLSIFHKHFETGVSQGSLGWPGNCYVDLKEICLPLLLDFWN